MPTPVKISLSAAADEKMRHYLRDQIRGLKATLSELHETRVVRWRKSYDAEPAEKIREFPFHGASNLIVPVIAIHVDSLLARVMSAIFKSKPLWTVRLLAEATAAPSDMRDAMEEGMQYLGIEPSELDLYRVYHEWCCETIKFGTSVVKVPWVRLQEDQVVPAGDGSGSFDYLPQITYEGPRPEKIAFEDFKIAPSDKTVELANFKSHTVHLKKFDLEERAFRRIYDPERVKVVLTQADRTSPSTIQTQKETDAGVNSSGLRSFQEWDIEECHFRYRVNGHYVKCIVSYHERTDTILRAYYNYYPTELFVAARLFYRDDMFYGYGFCETLEMLQEEISQVHNGRRDNQTVANTRVWRVSTDSKLHQGYKIYPSAMLPADPGEIEPLAHGDLSQINIEEERLTLELADKRSGVSPPQQGYGAGFNTKRGVYTAMGTLSLLQEGNTRTDLNITDIRYAHTKLGRILAREYAAFGLGASRIAAMGKRGELFEQALLNLKENKLALPVYASSASVNREVEKQNDLMFTGILARHYQAIAGMLQVLENPVIPENVKSYTQASIKGSNILMRLVARHFGFDEAEQLVPEPPAEPPVQQPVQPVHQSASSLPGVM